MVYQEIELTLSNYKKYIRSSDIRDIVRACLEDNVDISDYIEQCEEDPFRLWQIKYCIQEGMPKQVIERIGYGSVLYRLRQLRSLNIPISSMLSSLLTCSTEKIMNAYLTWVYSELPVTDLNMSFLSEDALEAFEFGLCQGYDMRIFTTRAFSGKELSAYLSLLENNQNISVILSNKYSEDIVVLLSHYGDRGYFKEIQGYLIKDIDYMFLKEALLLCKYKRFIPVVFAIDKKTNKYIMSYERLHVLNLCIEQGADPEQLLSMGMCPVEELKSMGNKSFIDKQKKHKNNFSISKGCVIDE